MTETVDIVNISVYVDIVNTGRFDKGLHEEGRMAEQTSGGSDLKAFSSLPMLEILDRFP